MNNEISNQISVTALLETLIKNTLLEEIIWQKTNYKTYFEFRFSQKLSDKNFVIYKIFHFKTHDKHDFNVFMQKGFNYIPIYFSNSNAKILTLIKVININKAYEEIPLNMEDYRDTPGW
jgi:hypothetical protein